MAELEELFLHALDLPAAERESFLARECAGDERLKAAVLRLLASDEAAEEQTFWRGSALEAEAKHESPAGTLRVGQVLGDYRVVEVIGEGGMGTVYCGVRADAEYEQAVAIKIVRGGFDSAALAERFRQERQILANLNHPNIARLLDGGTTPDGLPYLVMEFIAGKPLTAYCDEHKLGVNERLRLFRQACSAVEFAHQRLVIHRDLKPGNILVTDDGQVKLLDFGVAKLVAAEGEAQQTVGMHWLTPAYASPEQVSGETMTTASDVYSLGVILYELLCGLSPYGKRPNTLPEAMRAVREDEPRPPGEMAASGDGGKALARKLKGDLDRITLKALRKEPARRYASVEQLSEDLRRHLEGLPVRAQGDSFGYRAGKFVRRNAVAVAAVAAVIVALAVGIVMTTRAEARAKRQFNEVRRLAHTVLFDYHDAIADLPGSTPVRMKLVKDALSYLDGLSRQQQDDDLEREIALAYVKVADVQGNTYNPNLGDTAGALESARKAVAHAEPLYKRDPSAENAYALGRAYLVLASVIHSSDQIAGAEEYYKRAAELFAKATAAQPLNLEWQTRRVATFDHLGDLYGLDGYSNLGRSREALAAYRQALDLSNQLAQENPNSHDIRQAQVTVMLSVAEAEHGLGHAAEAEAEYRRTIAANEALVAAPSSTSSDRQLLAVANFDLANQLRDRGKPEEAIPYMHRARAIVSEIAAADPQNTLYQRSLAFRELGLCDLYRHTGSLAQAQTLCREALAKLQKLSAADPGSGEFRSDVANAMRLLGEVELAAGNAATALTQERSALDLLHAMPEAERDENLQLYSLQASVTAGEAELKLGHKREAITDFQTAAAIGDKLVAHDPDNAYDRLHRARAKTLLAQTFAATDQCKEALAAAQPLRAEWSALNTMGIVPSAEQQQAEAAILEMAARCR